MNTKMPKNVEKRAKEVTKALRSFRLMYDLPLAEFERISGIDSTMLSLFETGVRTPNAAQVRAILATMSEVAGDDAMHYQKFYVRAAAKEFPVFKIMNFNKLDEAVRERIIALASGLDEIH